MPTTRSTTGALAWKCHRCNHANDTVRNKLESNFVTMYLLALIFLRMLVKMFGDARQIVGGSTNKLTAAGFERASKKASTFNAYGG